LKAAMARLSCLADSRRPIADSPKPHLSVLSVFSVVNAFGNIR
jgi:hypothetical protein